MIALQDDVIDLIFCFSPKELFGAEYLRIEFGVNFNGMGNVAAINSQDASIRFPNCIINFPEELAEGIMAETNALLAIPEGREG
jgi:hypothetical protein